MSQCESVNGSCPRCEGELPFEFTMAFQPIVDLSLARIVTYEALARGLQGESAESLIAKVTDGLHYHFDQACRVKAIEMASALGMQTNLSINFLPNAVHEPKACIQPTLAASKRVGWPIQRLIFEITETERIYDRRHLYNIINTYHSLGFQTALDDFGNGYANLDLLTELTPDTLKIDRELVMRCDSNPRRQVLLNAIISLAEKLDMTLIAEGVETRAEALWLARAGIVCQQGFYFAKPMVNALSVDLTARLHALRHESKIA